MILVVDFETYYDNVYSLKKMSTSEYVRDSRYETIGVALALYTDDLELVESHWMEDAQFRAFLDEGGRDLFAQNAALAHHAQFDGFILNERYDVRPKFWYDTLSMSRPLHGIDVGGSLKKLMEHYQVGEKGTEVLLALGKRRAQFSSIEWDQYGAYSMNDARGAAEILKSMLANGYPQSELEIIDLTVRMFTEPVLQLDEVKMRAFHADEIGRKNDLLMRIGRDKSVLMSNEKFAALLVSLGVEPPMKWSAKKNKMDYAFAKSDVEFKALAESSDPMVAAAVEARIGVKSTINETRATRLLAMGERGQTLPVYLKYAGAHTFRWSGGDKVNWQNFERVDVKKGKGAIRQSILAPAGHKIVVADSGQIELRTNMWLAGQEDVVEKLRNGADVYSDFASVAYGRPVNPKVNPDDKKARSVGKVCQLALGYGMGWPKLASTMITGPMGADPIYFTNADVVNLRVDFKAFANLANLEKANSIPAPAGVDIISHSAVCWHLTNVYRKSNAAVTRFWWEVCPELLDAMHRGVECELGPLKTVRDGLVLPSGLVMRYPELRPSDEPGEDQSYSYFNGKFRAKLYGGLLTENIVQALARVVISDQLRQVAARGYKVVTTTHDEIVLCVPDAQAQEAFDVMVEIMQTAPEWAEGLPLDAEGGIGQNYGDAK